MKRLTVSNAINSLKEREQAFKEVFSHGSLSIEIYKPISADKQQPHTRDEVYVIASGSGTFRKGNTRQKFEAGEIIFVPAGLEHKFEAFTDDFATWVFFYGPEGGE